MLSPAFVLGFAVTSVAAQMGWARVMPPTSQPGNRGDFAMTYDDARQRIVLFGGYQCISFPCRRTVPLGDTWEWNGSVWNYVTPPAGNPAPRADHAMAYDAARKRVMLFGGGARNDTWEWDGKKWTELFPTRFPSGRYGHAMAYDLARKRIVLFGGYDWANPQGLNDTWEWDGSNWTQMKPVTSPPPRAGHAMAYDAVARRVLLFGGGDAWGKPLFNDTWEWNGITWSRRKPASSPPVSGRPAMTYDAARQRVVLVSRGSGDTTWEWDGKNWTQCTSPSLQFYDMAVAYDAVSGSTLLLNADGWLGNAMWTYAPRDLIASTHVVPVGTGATVKLFIDPGDGRLGGNYWVVGCFDGSGQRGMVLSPTVKLLLYPDWYFQFTVNHPNTWIANSLGTLGGMGKATATIKVPSLPPWVIGYRFYHAYAVFRSKLEYASTPVPLTLVYSPHPGL